MDANVTEAGDIVVFAIVLVMTIAVGGALLAVDTVVRLIREKRGRE